MGPFCVFHSYNNSMICPHNVLLTNNSYLQESRTGRNILHHLVPLLRQSIYSRLAGYDDTNDAVRLSQDPAMRVIVGWQGSERKGASTSEMGRFETEFLSQEDNLKGLARINTQWVERAMAHTLHRRVILDMDSSESPVHGQQEGAAYNGHFECVCYHPLFLFNQFGDCEAAKLRSGNVHSADDWQEVLDPVVERYLTAAVPSSYSLDNIIAVAATDRNDNYAGFSSYGKTTVDRPELDEVVLPQVRGQSGQAGVVRTGLQPGQLHEKASLTGGNEALVVDQSADQDDQDWRTVGAPCRKAGVSAC